jgi:hypothetical protein
LFHTERASATGNVRWMRRSHAAIDVRRISPSRRKSGELIMIGRAVAHGIGCVGVTGEREGWQWQPPKSSSRR